MRNRFDVLANEADVFRFATQGGHFLPPGRRKPDSEWLRPTSDDKEEAKERGRVPGLSCWQSDGTGPATARALVGRSVEDVAFEANVGAIRRVAALVASAQNEPAIQVEVLHDPAERYRPEPGWEQHAVIEGLDRPPMAKKSAYTTLRSALVGCFEPLDG